MHSHLRMGGQGSGPPSRVVGDVMGRELRVGTDRSAFCAESPSFVPPNHQVHPRRLPSARCLSLWIMPKVHPGALPILRETPFCGGTQGPTHPYSLEGIYVQRSRCPTRTWASHPDIRIIALAPVLPQLVERRGPSVANVLRPYCGCSEFRDGAL
ncbi:hypothetical protein VUR80DRAFT_3791 [Thermomyces stellatus]